MVEVNCQMIHTDGSKNGNLPPGDFYQKFFGMKDRAGSPIKIAQGIELGFLAMDKATGHGPCLQNAYLCSMVQDSMPSMLSTATDSVSTVTVSTSTLWRIHGMSSRKTAIFRSQRFLLRPRKYLTKYGVSAMRSAKRQMLRSNNNGYQKRPFTDA